MTRPASLGKKTRCRCEVGVGMPEKQMSENNCVAPKGRGHTGIFVDLALKGGSYGHSSLLYKCYYINAGISQIYVL